MSVCVLPPSLHRDLLQQHFSDFNVDMKHPGILLKCGSWSGISDGTPDGFLCDADVAVCGPTSKSKALRKQISVDIIKASKVHRLVKKSFPFLSPHDDPGVLKVSPSLMVPGASPTEPQVPSLHPPLNVCLSSLCLFTFMNSGKTHGWETGWDTEKKSLALIYVS